MDLVPGKEVSPGSSERGADRWCIGVSAIVKVWLRDGACHEDVGYGKIENAKSKGDALDKVCAFSSRILDLLYGADGITSRGC